MHGQWLFAVALSALPLWLIHSSEGAISYKAHIPGVTAGPVDISSYEHLVTRSGGSVPIHADLHITKILDRATPVLVGTLCDGQSIPSVQIEARETDPMFTRYFKIMFSEVFISSIQTGGDTDSGEPMEQVSMNYAKIEWTYIQTDAVGRPGNAGSTYWDQNTDSGGTSDPDTDGDGMPDSYEVTHGLLLLDDDAGDDDDGDGVSNNDEFRAGTSASDSNSVFVVSGISKPLGSGFAITVTFESVPGREYDLYAVSAIDAVPGFVETVTAASTTTTRDLNLPENVLFVLVKVRVD